MTETPRISPVREDNRTIFLERIVPKWAWSYTCRCRKAWGMVFDTTRLMWVCTQCRLPAGYKMDIGRAAYMKDCIGCGDDFVVWMVNKPNSDIMDLYCEKCGGTNAAKKGQRTPDPHAIEDDD